MRARRRLRRIGAPMRCYGVVAHTDGGSLARWDAAVAALPDLLAVSRFVFATAPCRNRLHEVFSIRKLQSPFPWRLLGSLGVNEPAYRRELAEPLLGAPCVVAEALHRSRPWFRLKPAAWLMKPCSSASAPPRRGAAKGAIVRFRWSPCLHMKDASRNMAYKQKGPADAVDAGKALRCALSYTIWARSLLVYISSQFRC